MGFEQAVVAVNLHHVPLQPVRTLPQHDVSLISDLKIVIGGNHLLGARVKGFIFVQHPASGIAFAGGFVLGLVHALSCALPRGFVGGLIAALIGGLRGVLSLTLVLALPSALVLSIVVSLIFALIRQV